MYILRLPPCFRVVSCVKNNGHYWRQFYHSHALNCCSQRSNVPEQYVELFKTLGSSRLRRGAKEKRLDKLNVSTKEYLYGRSPCMGALEANRRRFYAIYLNEDTSNIVSRLKKLKYMAEKRNVAIKMVPRKRLDDLCNNRPHQNIVMKVGNLSTIPLEKKDLNSRDLDAGRSPNRPPLWLVLQGIQDPMNLGAILRTSAYLGVDKVVTSQSDSCPLTPAVSKASAGAMEGLPVYSTNIIQLLKDKLQKNWDIIGTVHPHVAPEGPRCTPVVPCNQFRLEKPSLLVLGNEGSGLTDEVQALCTKFLTIQPQLRHSFCDLDSLNVSVATDTIARNCVNIMKFWSTCLRLKLASSGFPRGVKLTRHTHSQDTSFDVVLVGGGVMGLSTAYFLAKRMDPSSICIVERDTKYSQSATAKSWGSIRQQFSIPENIEMSKFGFHFLENVNNYLSIEGEDPADLPFTHGTYCYLASDAGKHVLEENAVVQRSLDVPISLLTKAEIELKYPWMNTENVAMASDVSHGEGWFDPWLLLSHFKNKVSSMGVRFIEGEVKSIDTDESGQISGVKVTKPNSTDLEKLSCGNLVNTAGAWADSVAHMINIDLPVCPAKRVTFVVHCPEGPTDPVLLIDTIQNIFLRPEGGQQYIVMGQPEEEGSDSPNEVIDYDFFDNDVWPKLAYRIPAFERLKVTSAWVGFYEYNTADQNGIISAHPEVKNFFFANGFSGHGIQQSPAVGRAISELILDGGFQTIDLSRYSYERFYDNKLIIEKNVI